MSFAAGGAAAPNAVIGASPDGTIDYDRAGYRHPCVIMLGEERSGLSEAQRSMCQQIVGIPMVEAVNRSILQWQAA